MSIYNSNLNLIECDWGSSKPATPVHLLLDGSLVGVWVSLHDSTQTGQRLWVHGVYLTPVVLGRRGRHAEGAGDGGQGVGFGLVQGSIVGRRSLSLVKSSLTPKAFFSSLPRVSNTIS